MLFNEMSIAPAAIANKMGEVFNLRRVNRNTKSNQVNILEIQGIFEELFWVQEVGQCHVYFVQFR